MDRDILFRSIPRTPCCNRTQRTARRQPDQCDSALCGACWRRSGDFDGICKKSRGISHFTGSEEGYLPRKHRVFTSRLERAFGGCLSKNRAGDFPRRNLTALEYRGELRGHNAAVDLSPISVAGSHQSTLSYKRLLAAAVSLSNSHKIPESFSRSRCHWISSSV